MIITRVCLLKCVAGRWLNLSKMALSYLPSYCSFMPDLHLSHPDSCGSLVYTEMEEARQWVIFFFFFLMDASFLRQKTQQLRPLIQIQSYNCINQTGTSACVTIVTFYSSVHYQFLQEKLVILREEFIVKMRKHRTWNSRWQLRVQGPHSTQWLRFKCSSSSAA